jgi:hypothetical protein
LLRKGRLSSTLYKELPFKAYFTFKLCMLEEHASYLKNQLHHNCQQIIESEEMLESFIPLKDTHIQFIWWTYVINICSSFSFYSFYFYFIIYVNCLNFRLFWLKSLYLNVLF